MWPKRVFGRNWQNLSWTAGEGLPKVWQKTTNEELDKQEEDLKKFHNTYDGRVQVWFGLRTIFNCTDDLIVRSKELADKYNVGVHMHVAEVKDEVDICGNPW